MAQDRIQDCMRRCRGIANDLLNITSEMEDPTSRLMLNRAAAHVEECIKGCDMAARRVQPGYGPAGPGPGPWR